VLGTVALGVPAVALGPAAVDLVLPEVYQRSGDLVQILVMALVMSGFFRLSNGATIFYSGRRWSTLTTTVIGVAANAALNLALIPRLGLDGVALASLATFSTLAAVSWAIGPLHGILHGVRAWLYSAAAAGLALMALTIEVRGAAGMAWSVAFGLAVGLAYGAVVTVWLRRLGARTQRTTDDRDRHGDSVTDSSGN
jgi:O-antigen/teichoic acid export membrane protein